MRDSGGMPDGRRKFVFAVSGTRGDIQPAVVIAAELAQRGHRIVFGAPPNLVDFAARAGLDARPFGYDTRAHMSSDLVRKQPSTGGPRTRLRALGDLMNAGWDAAVADLATLAPGADGLITGFTTEQVALPFAEHHSAALITLHHAPVRRNAIVSAMPTVTGILPSWATETSWTVVEGVAGRLTRARQRRLRVELGLPARSDRISKAMSDYGSAEVQVYDGALCPPPPGRTATGFVDLPPRLRRHIGTDCSTTDPDLNRWLECGTAPVYFGFGSMPIRDPQAVLDAIVAASTRLGARALVSAGWNDLDAPESDDLRLAGELDHASVFPRCRAIVHHGGAGTTAAALRAGKPALVCWVSSDQPLWGSRLEKLGAGASMPLREVNADSLTAKLRAVLDPACAVGAAAVAANLIPPARAVATTADAVVDAERRFRELRYRKPSQPTPTTEPDLSSVDAVGTGGLHLLVRARGVRMVCRAPSAVDLRRDPR